MRECPVCGYKDPPYWRNVRFRIFTSCCHLEDFKQLKPKLAEQIITEIDVFEKPYIYHLVKKANIVQRIHMDDSMDGKSWREPEQEKSFKFKNPNQSLLAPLVGDIKMPNATVRDNSTSLDAGNIADNKI